MTKSKAHSWVKHVVSRWREFYFEIQRIDGQVDLSNPLRALYRNESQILLRKTTPSNTLVNDSESQDKSNNSHPPPSTKSSTTSTQLEKITAPKPKHKQTKSQSLLITKNIHFFFNPF